MRLARPLWANDPNAKTLLSALEAEGGRTRLVGGAVRDSLRGAPTDDIDLATELAPEDVMRRLEAAGLKAIPTGLKHGTVTAVAGDLVAEVTTLRRDVETYGRHAEVAFTDDWREDASRRDFTFNAMNARLPSGDVEDYFGGAEDLAAGRVRFIGEPRERIAEDHLRILRFFRFHARYGQGEPDQEGLAACTERANDLMALSRERIAAELLKMLGGEDPAPTIRMMTERGIWKPVIPEFSLAGADRLADLVTAEKRHDISASAIRRLASLIPHDPEAAAEVGARLRLSRAQQRRLVAAVDEAGTGAEPEAAVYFSGQQTALDRALLRGAGAESISRIRGFEAPRLPISGGDLIRRGLVPGPEVSRRLKRFEMLWAEAGFPEDSESQNRLIDEALA